MADTSIKCLACNGYGYTHCDCWPGDCICGFGDITCDECYGSGAVDPEYDDYPDYDTPSTSGGDHG